jgi:hypothetical protein
MLCVAESNVLHYGDRLPGCSIPPAPVWVVIHRHVYHGCRQIPDTCMACVDPHLLPQWCGLMYITSTGTRRYHIQTHWQVAHLLLSALPRLITPNLNAFGYGEWPLSCIKAYRPHSGLLFPRHTPISQVSY